MCDYSLEHLRSTRAKEGESYALDINICHGFVTKESMATLVSRGPTVVCVRPGQKLQLSDIEVRFDLVGGPRGAAPKQAIVTVVHQGQDPLRFRHFGPFGDGILFESGLSIPIAWLVSCEMTVLPAEQPKLPKRSLTEMLGFTIPKARELEDAD